MLDLARRSFIAGIATIPFSVWLERNVMAQAPFVRYSVERQIWSRPESEGQSWA